MARLLVCVPISCKVFSCFTVQEAGIQPAAPREAWPLPKLVRVLDSMQQTGGWVGGWVGDGSGVPLLPLQPSQRFAQ
jgi:hypothetical protein